MLGLASTDLESKQNCLPGGVRPPNANFRPRRRLHGTMSGHISRCQSLAPLCAGNGLGRGRQRISPRSCRPADQVRNRQTSSWLGYVTHRVSHPLSLGYRETVRDIHLRIRSMTIATDCLVIAPPCATWVMKRYKAIQSQRKRGRRDESLYRNERFHSASSSLFPPSRFFLFLK